MSAVPHDKVGSFRGIEIRELRTVYVIRCRQIVRDAIGSASGFRPDVVNSEINPLRHFFTAIKTTSSMSFEQRVAKDVHVFFHDGIERDRFDGFESEPIHLESSRGDAVFLFDLFRTGGLRSGYDLRNFSAFLRTR